MTESAPAKHSKQLPVWQESIVLVVTALLLAFVVKTFFVQAFYIPSGSMEPTMVVNDKLLVQKVSYWTGSPQRGDIIVFKDPDHWLDSSEVRTAHNPVQKALEFVGLFPTGGHLIKRVIGVGGDTVSCCDVKGRMQVNGTSVTEPYLMNQTSNTAFGSFSVKVKKGYLWVQGDNRGDSADSRAHMNQPGGGQVPVKDVVGKAWLRVWPLGRFGFITNTDAFDKVRKPE